MACRSNGCRPAELHCHGRWFDPKASMPRETTQHWQASESRHQHRQCLPAGRDGAAARLTAPGEGRS